MRVLLAEHDARLATEIQAFLNAHGMIVDTASTGEAVLARVAAMCYGVIVIDAELPDVGGIDACRALRAREVWAPVLIIAPGDRTEDRIAGLEAGADDCLARPFALPEFIARLRAIVRRGVPDPQPVLRVGDLTLDLTTYCCHRGEVPINLTATECALLHTLMNQAGEVLDRVELLEHVWGPEEEKSFNLVEVYVSYLRRKVDRPFGTASIETVRGVGYRIRADGGRSELRRRPRRECRAPDAERHSSA
jgi:two-component system OmpR family response regulator